MQKQRRGGVFDLELRPLIHRSEDVARDCDFVRALGGAGQGRRLRAAIRGC